MRIAVSGRTRDGASATRIAANGSAVTRKRGPGVSAAERQVVAGVVVEERDGHDRDAHRDLRPEAPAAERQQPERDEDEPGRQPEQPARPDQQVDEDLGLRDRDAQDPLAHALGEPAAEEVVVAEAERAPERDGVVREQQRGGQDPADPDQDGRPEVDAAEDRHPRAAPAAGIRPRDQRVDAEDRDAQRARHVGQDRPAAQEPREDREPRAVAGAALARPPQRVERGEQEERRRGVAEQHRCERERDRAEAVAHGDDQRPDLPDGGAQEPEQEHGEDRGQEAAGDERHDRDRGLLVGDALPRERRDAEQHRVGRDRDERRAGRLVRVVMPVAEGLVARVVLEPVDLRRAVLDDRPHQVVPAVLVPGRDLLEVAEAEQEAEEHVVQLAPGRDAQPPPAGIRRGRWGRVRPRDLGGRGVVRLALGFHASRAF